MSTVLRTDSVGVARDGRPILRDVDLRVNAGDVLAVLGANGSGKSTLVRACLGLLPLTAGRITLFDEDLDGFRDWSRVGYVPQHGPAAQSIPASVREVVASGRLARRRAFVPARAADRSAVDEALGVVGLADRADHPYATLSGGQRQRVLIARALAGEPDLLVLDEPNAGVDLVSQEAIARALRTLRDEGHTIMVVLHELGPLADLINRTIVLREGRVAHDAPVDHDHGHDAHCDVPAPTPDVVPGLAGPWDEVR